ncbi:MAG TPA: MFS transporter [Holophagaceae bacterium]|nr:MFS transporter [Holophagaceae bacterium]
MSATPTGDDASLISDSSTIRRVIFASSLGTLFEWYDFYLYGSLAVFFGSKFFPPGNETAQLLASLATFGAGFGVRPLGALVFGHIGDLIGRKYTFLVTMATMGLSTALVGLLPTYDQIGIWATIILVLLRLLQGLALGGEYGGAATYVAEHVPDERRGYYTSYIQTTATLGFFVSMGVIGCTRYVMGEDAFKTGAGHLMAGWRIPFLISFALLIVSLYIRVKMQESPLFSKLKTAKKISVNPLKESFTNPVNLRYVLLALFGATAGQGVVWYTGQFYALTFIQAVLKIHWLPAYLIISVALALGTPFFLVFGHLSDKIGRKRIMMLGCALAAATYVPIYMAMRHFTPALLPGQTAVMLADLPTFNLVMMILLVFIQLIYVTMVYGPIAAFLVELFPTNIRYTSMSLPYHIGNGWFGGFLPLIATAVAASAATKEAFGAGAIFAGLIYPIAIALITLTIGGIFIKETKDHKIDTAISLEAVGEPFDWNAVLIALVLGFAVLLGANADFRADLGKIGVFKAIWSGIWYPLFGAMGLFALPTIFFRLEYQRYRSIVTVFGCTAITWLVSIFMVPVFVGMGGMFKFFAYTLILGIYTVILTLAYRMGRPKVA